MVKAPSTIGWPCNTHSPYPFQFASKLEFRSLFSSSQRENFEVMTKRLASKALLQKQRQMLSVFPVGLTLHG
ncbi:hypothetical protein I3843_15G045900 [Carya illinoinensis]|nr:hypothetical protein I3843_15G045900 [Carya illinoinensis]